MRPKFDLRTTAGTLSLRCYDTAAPGLVAYRYAGGWELGHFPTGLRVTNWPLRTKDQALELAQRFAPLTDWARAEVPDLLGLGEACLEIERGVVTPFTACGAEGADGRCLERTEHKGAHGRHGKRWRD